MKLTGECFCGEVKYEINGSLRDARSCHCSRCRKVFSSQASAYAVIDASEFRWVKGVELLTTFKSQKDFGFQFCKRCGSTLCGTYKDQVHGITLGCLNEDPNIEIGRHIFVGSKASWEVIPDSIVQYEKNSPEDS
ncbi:GFA family protein [Thalassotalea profundi]|uniref:Aldehyde-activating protein n=1 Tax=Thalassotalea profundi TaxID=2036687 RepID=A0ABQ3IMP4_9GAMM|nr:GFA family protein [Thalassotalea profundi]GHE85480.1 aldehyde-activating protein [Thalassotalea profundi]